MNVNIKIPNYHRLDNIFIQKLIFINNALNNGWQIKKNNENYIFTKPHKGKKEVHLDNYLQEFINQNLIHSLDINNIN